jgi:hypothetical protein
VLALAAVEQILIGCGYIVRLLRLTQTLAGLARAPGAIERTHQHLRVRLHRLGDHAVAVTQRALA